tara:strand:- start:101 stop:424 length:324 start_codon:yes stop_codon:yes gene_type:complete
MLNKIFKIIVSVSILAFSVNICFDYQKAPEGYFLCDAGCNGLCSDDIHHGENKICLSCTNQENSYLATLTLLGTKFISSKSKFEQYKNPKQSYSLYINHNKSPPSKI